MNREILFRGKRLDSENWVYGDLSHHDDDRIFIRYWNFGFYTSYEVDPSTVGQYTGLKDKNGKKIFEGDVVHCRGGEFFAGYNEIDEKNLVKDITDGICVYLFEVESIDIIGNIYDNPELLEQEEVGT